MQPQTVTGVTELLLGGLAPPSRTRSSMHTRFKGRLAWLTGTTTEHPKTCQHHQTTTTTPSRTGF